MKRRKINYEKLFKKYPLGYDCYREWLIDMCRMCAKHPLDCDFLCEAWLLKWEALGRLLKQRAMLIVDGEYQRGHFDVGTALARGMGACRHGYSAKVRLWATATIIHEWNANVAD